MKKKNWGRRTSNEYFSQYITPINGPEKKNVLVKSSDEFLLSPNYIPMYPTLTGTGAKLNFYGNEPRFLLELNREL